MDFEVEDIQKGISKPLQEMILSSDDEILTQSSISSFNNNSSRNEGTYPNRTNMYGGNRRNDDMDYDDDDEEDEDIDEDDYDDQLG